MFLCDLWWIRNQTAFVVFVIYAIFLKKVHKYVFKQVSLYDNDLMIVIRKLSTLTQAVSNILDM